MFSLVQRHLAFVILIGTDQLLVVEVLHTLEIGLGLLEVNFCQTHTHLSTRQLSHVRNHLDLGNHVASIDIVAWLLQQFRDDTRDLRLDIHLIARFYLTRDNGGFLDAV